MWVKIQIPILVFGPYASSLASLPLAPLDRPFEERAERRARQRSAPHNHFSRHDGRETNCGDRGSAEEETPACWAGGRSGNGGSVINS